MARFSLKFSAFGIKKFLPAITSSLSSDHITLNDLLCPLRKEKVREDVEGCRSGLFYVKVYHCKGKGKGKVCIQAKWPIQPELILVSLV